MKLQKIIGEFAVKLYGWSILVTVPKVVIYHPHGCIVLSREAVLDDTLPKEDQLLSLACSVLAKGYTAIAKVKEMPAWAFSDPRGSVLLLTSRDECFSPPISYTKEEFADTIGMLCQIEDAQPLAKFIFDLVRKQA